MQLKYCKSYVLEITSQHKGNLSANNVLREFLYAILLFWRTKYHSKQICLLYNLDCTIFYFSKFSQKVLCTLKTLLNYDIHFLELSRTIRIRIMLKLKIEWRAPYNPRGAINRCVRLKIVVVFRLCNYKQIRALHAFIFSIVC